MGMIIKNRAGTVRIKACGEDMAQAPSVKQESLFKEWFTTIEHKQCSYRPWRHINILCLQAIDTTRGGF